MPGFRGHTISNAVVMAGTTLYMTNQGWGTSDILAVDLGIIVSTLVLSPDMDVFTSKPMEEWGILKIFWWPYAKLVKHRDRLHTPILGTTVRWLYTLVLMALGILAVDLALRMIGVKINFELEDRPDSIIKHLAYGLDVFIGANIADAVHFILDVSTHGLKHKHTRHRNAFWA